MRILAILAAIVTVLELVCEVFGVLASQLTFLAIVAVAMVLPVVLPGPKPPPGYRKANLYRMWERW